MCTWCIVCECVSEKQEEIEIKTCKLGIQKERNGGKVEDYRKERAIVGRIC